MEHDVFNRPSRTPVLATLHTGVRRKELLGMKIRDLDFTRRVTRVQASYAKMGSARHS